jgi:trans-aconitate 2-methyltransferase
MPTWDAAQYLRFNDERTRPCRELAARIAIPAPGRVMDLGCGPGNSASVLAERWPKSELTGLDSSPGMIAAARQAYPHLAWRVGDIAAWAGENRQTHDIVFSNAALQWVDDHAALFPKLLSQVAAGGALAIQMPANFDAPAHCIMRELAASPAWRDHFPAAGIREWHVHDLAAYHDILAPIAVSVDFWQTEYLHIMADAAAIVEWYKGTGLRPFLDALANDQQRAGFTAQYLEGIERAYPVRRDGRVIFPFRRLFLIAYQAARPEK